MTDTIIKGTGNSRTLKTVPNALTLYPNFDAMIAAMVDGSFPIDLGPLNAAGVQQQGTPLNKATLLKDATATLYGKATTATVDDILSAIYSNKISKATGSYVGNGERMLTISLPLTPVIVIIEGDGNQYIYSNGGKIATNYLNKTEGPYMQEVTFGQNYFYLQSQNASYIQNVSGRTYRYVAIG